MSYVIWSSLWHIILPGEEFTLCGRHVPADLKRRELPPPEVFICLICGTAA